MPRGIRVMSPGSFERFATVQCRAIERAVMAAVQRSGGVRAVKHAYYETFEHADGQFGFRLFAANGEQVGQSEGYTSQSGAERGAMAHSRAAIDAASQPIRRASSGD
jgi:uncharacterized protein YegP (UPF0339 family)